MAVWLICISYLVSTYVHSITNRNDDILFNVKMFILDILMSLIVFRDVVLLLAGVYIRYISIPSPVRSKSLCIHLKVAIFHLEWLLQRTLKKYFDHKHSTAQLSPTLISKINTAVQLTTALLSLYGSANTDFPEDYVVYSW